VVTVTAGCKFPKYLQPAARNIQQSTSDAGSLGLPYSVVRLSCSVVVDVLASLPSDPFAACMPVTSSRGTTTADHD
jgi:hypothetical protein